MAVEVERVNGIGSVCRAVGWLIVAALGVSIALPALSGPLAGDSGAPEPVRVYLEDGFSRAGMLSLQPGARLTDALGNGGLATDACQLQGLWLRPSLQGAQQRLKQGLLFDLQTLEAQAVLEGEGELAAWAAELGRLIQRQPVTGREPGQSLVRERLQAIKGLDRPLLEGDSLRYPPCKRSLRILETGGWRIVAHDAALSAEDAIALSERQTWQEPGYLWVVRADGTFERSRIGHWRAGAPVYAGAAATLFRPLSERWAVRINPDFNLDLARWLATQEYRDDQP